MTEPPPALTTRDLAVWYGSSAAVRGIDLSLLPGETVALIGETGSGKTSFAHAVAQLLPASTRVEGSIRIGGVELLGLSAEQRRESRGRQVGFVPQDAMAALNPTMRIGRQVAEPFEIHEGLRRHDAERRAIELLQLVRIDDAARVTRLFPHELSGGMRQRVMIAMALSLRPPLIVADEPTTALDVSTQADVIGLVDVLRRETGVAFLWITHDMGVVSEIADRVAVMYRGKIVELGTAREIFDAPAHPYTDALLHTLRDLREGDPGDRLFQIEGQPPGIDRVIDGCAFHPRCPRATDLCREEDPGEKTLGTRTVRCHHAVEEVS